MEHQREACQQQQPHADRGGVGTNAGAGAGGDGAGDGDGEWGKARWTRLSGEAGPDRGGGSSRVRLHCHSDPLHRQEEAEEEHREEQQQQQQQQHPSSGRPQIEPKCTAAAAAVASLTGTDLSGGNSSGRPKSVRLSSWPVSVARGRSPTVDRGTAKGSCALNG